jgi:uncharacterized protein (TIGR00255 family)
LYHGSTRVATIFSRSEKVTWKLDEFFIKRPSVLLSMTGFGEARGQSETFSLGVEVRSVNNRYLKVTVRGSEPYPMLEPELEKTVRRFVKRGTILIQIRCDRQFRPADFHLNHVALKTYIEQIQAVCRELNCPDQALLANVLTLPGVTSEPMSSGRPPDKEWELVEKTLESAMKRLQKMRQDEGRAMGEELLSHRRHIALQISQINNHLPNVTEAFRNRLRDRVSQALKETNVSVETDQLIREVAIFAERSDVAEEVMRLGSHLEQFEQIVQTEDDAPGRKLEFLTQEMTREANTIGSKAGDVTISRYVVEIKATLEKIREMVQNVE